MRTILDYKNMPLKDYPTIEEIRERKKNKKPYQDYVMTPEEKLEMAE